MKFLLFNVMVVVALVYLFLRGDGMPALPTVKAAAVAGAPVAPSQPRPPVPPGRAAEPVVETTIDVVPPVVHAVPDGWAAEPEGLPAGTPNPRRDLARIARDMDRFDADRLAR